MLHDCDIPGYLHLYICMVLKIHFENFLFSSEYSTLRKENSTLTKQNENKRRGAGVIVKLGEEIGLLTPGYARNLHP